MGLPAQEQILLAMALVLGPAAAVVPVTSTAAPYDCEDAKELEKWSEGKKAFCCDRSGIGCPSDAAETVDDASRFDCGTGSVQTWSLEQRAWCCTHSSIGCGASLRASGRHRLTAGDASHSSAAALSTSNSASTSASALFDCQAEFLNWNVAWPAEKKAWCCENEERGCPITTTAVSYDCMAGLFTWRLSWSAMKKAWCCEHDPSHGRGCATTTTVAEEIKAPLAEAGAHWVLGTTVTTSQAVASAASEFASASEPAEPFFCGSPGDPLLARRTLSWPEEKRLWCCGHYGRGCSTTTTSQTTTTHTKTSRTRTSRTTTSQTTTSTMTSTPTSTTTPTVTTTSQVTTTSSAVSTPSSTTASTTSSSTVTSKQTLVVAAPSRTAAALASTVANKTANISSLSNASSNLTVNSSSAADSSGRAMTNASSNVTANQSSADKSSGRAATNASSNVTANHSSADKSSGCDTTCVIDGTSASCSEHIYKAALNDFLGDPNSCKTAREMTVDRCPECKSCSGAAAGCGMLDLPTTTAAPKTSIAPWESCAADCWVDGQVATCESRVVWAAKNTYNSEANACAQALDLVQKQCPGSSGCGGCPLNATGCTDASGEHDAGVLSKEQRQEEEKDQEAKEDVDVTEGMSDRPYNCSELEEKGGSAGGKEEVEEVRRMAWWCCTHERKGCGEQAIFKRKFSSRDAPAATYPEGTKARPHGSVLPPSAAWLRTLPGLAGLNFVQASLACASLLFTFAASLLGVAAFRRHQSQVAIFREFRRHEQYHDLEPERSTQFALLAPADGSLD